MRLFIKRKTNNNWINVGFESLTINAKASILNFDINFVIKDDKGSYFDNYDLFKVIDNNNKLIISGYIEALKITGLTRTTHIYSGRNLSSILVDSCFNKNMRFNENMTLKGIIQKILDKQNSYSYFFNNEFDLTIKKKRLKIISDNKKTRFRVPKLEANVKLGYFISKVAHMMNLKVFSDERGYLVINDNEKLKDTGFKLEFGKNIRNFVFENNASIIPKEIEVKSDTITSFELSRDSKTQKRNKSKVNSNSQYKDLKVDVAKHTAICISDKIGELRQVHKLKENMSPKACGDYAFLIFKSILEKSITYTVELRGDSDIPLKLLQGYRLIDDDIKNNGKNKLNKLLVLEGYSINYSKDNSSKTLMLRRHIPKDLTGFKL